MANNTSLEPLRIIEAVLFAAKEPVPLSALTKVAGEGIDVPALLVQLQEHYATRGINLVKRDDRWAFRTAEDVAAWLATDIEQPRKLTRAALETLAIVAYHQPVTRGEIESIRGVAVSKGTLDTLLEAEWIRPGKRRDTPGRPVTWVTTNAFLDHFDLASLSDLPGVKELEVAGLLDKRPAIVALQDQGEEAADEETNRRLPLDDDSQ